MNNGPIIHLVMGVSNSGKSTFISKKVESGEWNGMPVLMAPELKNSNEGLLQKNCIVHYNLFRPYNNGSESIKDNFLSDGVLQKLLEYKQRIRAYVLVTKRSEIIKRCLLREQDEPKLKDKSYVYPRLQIFEFLTRLNLENFYMCWLVFLQRHGIQFSIINSSNNDFASVHSLDAASTIISSEQKAIYNKNEIEYIINNYHFEYQKIEIAPGIYTAGHDRSTSLQLIDKDLTGKTLLDIGCAYGYFCFEAEKRKAKKVVGTESKAHRYIGFNILKEIFGRKSEIYCRDVFERPFKERFDIVLLLNVIHHLKMPIQALRIAATMCREKLIIEYPTLNDKKYNTTVTNDNPLDSSLPLIGVSLLSAVDQTFLFSNEAIKRILMDHEKLFTKIEFVQSPMAKERSAAICYK